MKKLLLLTLTTTSFALKAQLTPLKSYDTPFSSLSGLAYDGQYLLIGNGTGGEIGRVDPIDGTQASTLIVDYVSNVNGLTSDGNTIYFTSSQLETDQDSIYEISVDGNFISKHPLNISNQSEFDLAWDGDNIYTLMWFLGQKDTIYKLDANYNTLEKFPTPEIFGKGLTYGCGYFWSTDNTGGEISLFQYAKEDLTVLDTIMLDPTFARYPNGAAWVGDYLWLSDNRTEQVHQYDVGLTGCTVISDLFKIEAKSLIIYPNPTQDDLYINGTENLSSFSILDLSGNRIHSGTVEGNRIPIAHLTEGSYTIVFQIDGVTQSKSFIKKN